MDWDDADRVSPLAEGGSDIDTVEGSVVCFGEVLAPNVQMNTLLRQSPRRTHHRRPGSIARELLDSEVDCS
jgi:hypothetical protein